MEKFKKLQVKIDDNWEYVYCCNESQCMITKNPKLALKVNDLNYFKNKFIDYEFRMSE